jgi:hypothetical protein
MPPRPFTTGATVLPRAAHTAQRGSFRKLTSGASTKEGAGVIGGGVSRHTASFASIEGRHIAAGSSARTAPRLSTKEGGVQCSKPGRLLGRASIFVGFSIAGERRAARPSGEKEPILKEGACLAVGGQGLPALERFTRCGGNFPGSASRLSGPRLPAPAPLRAHREYSGKHTLWQEGLTAYSPRGYRVGGSM